MNRGELKALALALVNEKGGYFANINIMCDLANRLVYSKVAQLDPAYLDEYAFITFPASSESIDLAHASYLNEKPLKVLGVEQVDSSLTVTHEHTATPYNHFHIGRANAGVYDGWALAQEHKLHLHPIASTARYIRVRWIPRVIAFTADGDQLLDQKAEEYHDLVLSTLVRLLRTTEATGSGLGKEFDDWLTDQITFSADSRSNDFAFPSDNSY